MGFIIRKLNESELKGLYEYMYPLWMDTYSFLPKNQVKLLLDKYFTYENILQYVKNGYEYYNLNNAGVLVFVEQKDALYVDKLYVLPEMRGKNYPHKAFEFLSKRKKPLILNVNINNKRAVNCYLKNGFKIIKKVDIDLGHGFINSDYIMKRETYCDLIIKKAQAHHLNALVDFYNEVLDYLEKTVNYPKWTPGEYPCKNTIEEVIKKGEQYVAFNQNKIVGAFVFNSDGGGDYSVGEWSKQLNDKEYAVIHTLATHPLFFGKGVAKQMVQFAIDSAKVQKYKAIRLDVVPTNFPAIKLYQSFGFTFAGEKDLKRGFKDIPTFCLYELNF